MTQDAGDASKDAENTVNETNNILNEITNEPVKVSLSLENIIQEDSVAMNSGVGQLSVTDLEGDAVAISLSDIINYSVDNQGAIRLTETGASLVNSGNELPELTIVVAAVTGDTTATSFIVDFDITFVNDPLLLDITAITTIVEYKVSIGDVMATATASDEDGNEITYSISDTTNYVINSSTGEVTLTQAGVDLVNSGNNLPSFTISATSTSGEISQTASNVVLPETKAFLSDVLTSLPNLDTTDIETTSTYANDYLDFGIWNNPIEGTSGTYIVGEITPSEIVQNLIDLPDASQSYAGEVAAIQTLNGEVSNVTGTVALDVNFATQTINGNMNVNDYWKADIAGTVSKYGFVADSVTGTANAVNEITGNLSGDFYGPAAEAVGGKFDLTDTVTSDTLQGVFGATSDVSSATR